MSSSPNTTGSFDFAFTPSRGPDKGESTRLAREAVAVTNRGDYATRDGRMISVRDDVKRAIANTVEHAPDEELSADMARPEQKATRTFVVNGTSLDVGRRSFAERGITPLILNFASAKNPGGGFLNGARAQEESLCRQSSLYACIVGRSMYAYHARSRDLAYASYMIYSPKVPVFIDEKGELLSEPWLASFITSPAPNMRAALDQNPGAARREELERALVARVSRLLTVAAHHNERHLVLGAWGCGVFGNDPAHVARLFREALDGAFAGVFDEVAFAVLDWHHDRRTIRPFVELFHQSG